MNTQEVKGTLAKLLATENLTVEHRRVSTACFDVNSRTLILPIWKTASNTVYDLLVGHEVGHALYTPNEDFGVVSKAFVNVIEDARIERMMKRTYPGLRKSFFEGYGELWEADFFGVKNDDINTLSLIDRINLYFKGNPNILFSDEEMVWVKRVELTKTFQDVTELAKELYDYCSEKQEEKDMTFPPPSADGNKQADHEEEVNPSSEDGDNESDIDSDFGEEIEQQHDPVSPSELTPYQGSDETKSVTDEALAQALETLVDDSAKEWVYINIPDPKIDDHIVLNSYKDKL